MSRKSYWFILLALLLTLALAACGGQNNGGTADVTPNAPAENNSNSGNNTDGLDEVTPDTNTDPTSEPSSPTDTGNLPALPALSAGGGGGGGLGGGGGDALAESGGAEPLPADGMSGGDGLTMPIYFENRLENAQFNLNSTLPAAPAPTAVWQLNQSEMSMEQMRDWANRFGFTGTLYTDPWYDQFVQENPGVWPGPRSYYAFDGARMLSFYGANVSYYDGTAAPTDAYWTLMPFEQARPLAESYLNDRGLLDFPYEIVASPYGDQSVSVYRLINGVRQTTPEISVSVAPTGNILSVYVQPFSAFTAVGDYPLITAEQAWELAQGTPDYLRVFHSVFTDPATIPMDTALPPTDFRSWFRTYQNGETITMYFYPIIYTAADGSAAPLVKTGEFTLIASDADLQTMAANLNQYIKVTGVVQGDIRYNQSLQVTSYEIIGQYQDWVYKQGTVRYADGQVYLDTLEGETFLIPDAPADLPDGEEVYVNGQAIEAGEPFGTFVWSTIEKVIVYSDEPVLIDPGVFPTPVPISQVNIDKVELVYGYSFTPAPDGNGPGGTWMQPAWRFTGTTDTGEIVELLVQAVAPEYLQPAG